MDILIEFASGRLLKVSNVINLELPSKSNSSLRFETTDKQHYTIIMRHVHYYKITRDTN